MTAGHLIRLFLCAALAAGAHAHAAPKPVHHYDVEQPETVKDALAIIREKLPRVETAEKQGKLETVHEESYYLEAAVDRLRKAPQTTKTRRALDALDEAVQILHYSSENGQAAEVKAVLPKLQAAAAEAEALF